MKIRLILFFLLFAAGIPLSGQVLKFPGSEYADISVEIRDIATGKVQLAVNSEKMLTPASTLKIVTSAAALTKYGPQYRYRTKAEFVGSIVDSTAIGNLIITGAGDPTLYSRHFPENQTFIADIANAVKRLGIRSICGDILLDDRCMPQQGPLPSWQIYDNFFTYGTGVYALNYHDNNFTLKLDEMITDPRFTDADVTYDFVAGEELQRYHGAFTDTYLLRGDAPARTTLVFPHSNPMSSFAEELTVALENRGIRFTDEYFEDSDTRERIHLATYESPDLKEIVKSLMFRSDNMMAEATLRLLAPGATIKEALDTELKLLKDSLGVENRYVRIMDGSGLTRGSFVSAAYLGKVLRAMAKSPLKTDFVYCFPRVGRDGTVRNLFVKTALKGRLALKSGSMSGVRCLAGYYLNSRGEPTKTVVVMVNDFTANRSVVNAAIEKLLVNELSH